jgi:hypothetical protein
VELLFEVPVIVTKFLTSRLARLVLAAAILLTPAVAVKVQPSVTLTADLKVF